MNVCCLSDLPISYPKDNWRLPRATAQQLPLHRKTPVWSTSRTSHHQNRHILSRHFRPRTVTRKHQRDSLASCIDTQTAIQARQRCIGRACNTPSARRYSTPRQQQSASKQKAIPPLSLSSHREPPPGRQQHLARQQKKNYTQTHLNIIDIGVLAHRNIQGPAVRGIIASTGISVELHH